MKGVAVNIMKAIKDIAVKAIPDGKGAIAEGESATGMLFMKRQFGETTARLHGDDFNDFFNELRERELTFRFTHG